METLAILILGFFVGKFWIHLDKRGKAMHDIDKLNLSFVLILVMFLLFYLGAQLGNTTDKVPAFIIIVGFIICAVSELSLSAIGLSLMTKIAPKDFVSLYMGIWLVTLGIGGKIGGLLAQTVTISGKDIAASKVSMQHGILIFISIAIVAIIICFISRKFIIANISNKQENSFPEVV